MYWESKEAFQKAFALAIPEVHGDFWGFIVVRFRFCGVGRRWGVVRGGSEGVVGGEGRGIVGCVVAGWC